MPTGRGISLGAPMVLDGVKNAAVFTGYTVGTLFGFAIDNITGIVAAVVGGLFIGVSIALPRALPALKSAGAVWLEYCAKRDAARLEFEAKKAANELAAWERTEAAHLAARLAEDEKMRPTLTLQLDALKQQAARLEGMLDEAKEEAKAAKDEARAAKDEAARNSALTEAGTARQLRHTDANLENINRLREELAKREALAQAEAGTKEIVEETAYIVKKIEGATVPHGESGP